MHKHRLLSILVLAAFAAGILLWKGRSAHQLTRLPADFRYEAAIYSRDDFFDPKHGRFVGEFVSEGHFSLESVAEHKDALELRSDFRVRKLADTLFAVTRTLGVDRETWTHRPGLGDRDRRGNLFGPRWEDADSIGFWYSNYDIPARLALVGQEEIRGLRVRRYVGDFRIEDARPHGFRFAQPGDSGRVELDVHLNVWVEPLTGWLVKLAEDATAWTITPGTGDRGHPLVRFRNDYTRASVEEHVRRAERARHRILWAGPWSTGVLVLAILLALALWLRPWQTIISRPGGSAPREPTPLAAWIAGKAAVILGLLGLAVMAGWLLRFPPLVEVLPGLAPMQFNTALSFLFVGISLWGASRRWKGVRRSAAGATAALAAAVLLQYFAGMDLGLDNLVVDYRGFGETRFGPMEHPGRMAPMTALCFLLSGSALVLKPRAEGSTLVGVFASLVLAMGGLASLGYFLGLPQAYRLGPWVPVAFHTVLGFLILGGALLALSGTERATETRPQRLVVFSWSGGLGFLVILYLALVSREQQMIEAEGVAEADRVSRRISEELQARIGALRRMQERWLKEGGIPKDRWEDEVDSYVRDYPGIQAINWVDTTWHARWVHPLAGNEAALGLNQTLSEARRSFLDRSLSTGHPAASMSLDLVQGGRGFAMAFPLGSGENGGFLFAVFQFDRLLDQLIREAAAEGHGVVLQEGREVLYSYRHASGGTGRVDKGYESPLVFLNREWRLTLEPRPVWSGRMRSILPETVLVTGLLVLLLATLSISLSWRSGRHAELLRQEQELALKRENRFRQFLEAAPDAVVVADAGGRMVLVNAQTERMFGYTREELAGKPVELLMPERFRHGHPANRDRYFAEPRTRPMGEGFALTARRKDGTEFPVEISLSPLPDEGGTLAMSLIRDVTDQRRIQHLLAEQADLLKAQRAEAFDLARSAEEARRSAEEAERQASSSLLEKETLLKEVHHRVKNNLQIVSTLLHLQAHKVKDPEALTALQDSEDRVQSMALLHENLYQAGDLAQVDFGAYLRNLAAELLSAHDGHGGKVRLETAADIQGVNLEKAVPLGLLVNELVVNAVKHAFPGDRTGSIAIRLEQLPEGRARLTVKDDGVGLPEGAEAEAGSSLGLQIIASLSRQLRGTYAFRRGGGTEYRLDFPLEEET